MAEYLQAKLGDLEDLVVMPLPDWGHVSRTAEETDNPYADVQTQVRLRTSALRHPSFKVKLEASTKDELISAENELRAELAKPTNTLTITPRGATRPAVLRLLHNETPIAEFDYAWDRAFVGIYTVELVAEPWVYGERDTLWTASRLTSPVLVDVGTLDGQAPMPLDFTITRGWGGENVGIQMVLAAVTHSGAVTGDYLYEAEDATEPGDWELEEGAINQRGDCMRLRSAVTTEWRMLYGIVDQAKLPTGRYRLFARAKCSGGSGVDNCWISQGRQENRWARDPRSRYLLQPRWEWVDLGPWMNGSDDGPSIWARARDGAAYVDTVLCLPSDLGWLRYDDYDEETEYVRFGWMYDHEYATTEAPTAARPAARRIRGHGLKLGLEGESLFILVEPNGSNPAPEFLLNGSYVPRWEMWPEPVTGS